MTAVNYKPTLRACYLGYVTQAVVNNLEMCIRDSRKNGANGPRRKRWTNVSGRAIIVAFGGRRPHHTE